MRHLLSFSLCFSLSAAVSIKNLRCEYLAGPHGIDALHPRLSWVLDESDPARRGTAQTAYRFTAGARPGASDRWD